MNYIKTKLSNGLRIITVPLKNTKAVTVLVLVKTGSRNESKNINGISHFIEHMLFKGTKNKPDKFSLVEPLDRIGGEYNAFTSKEYTGYWAKVDEHHLEIALDWVSDILMNSLFREKDIETERNVIIEEINMYLDTPSKYVFDLWENLLYKNHPLGQLTIGKKEIISKLKREQFINYFNKHYFASNIVVCVAGSEKVLRKSNSVADYFKKCKRGKVLPQKKIIEKQTKPGCLVHFKNTDQTHLCLGVRGYGLFHKNRYIQGVLATILGGYMTSRLWMKLREKESLCYYVSTYSSLYTDTGYLVTRAGVDNNKVDKAIKIILEEYKRIKEEKISNEELKKAKDNIKGNTLLEMESSDAWASYFGFQEILTNKIISLEEKLKEIDKVTVNDIQKLARDIFQPNKLNLALIGPFKRKEKFEKLLRI